MNYYKQFIMDNKLHQIILSIEKINSSGFINTYNKKGQLNRILKQIIFLGASR